MSFPCFIILKKKWTWSTAVVPQDAKIVGGDRYRGKHSVGFLQKWISTIKQARREQKKTERWEPTGNGFRLCSDHFVSGTDCKVS